jgi:hypothetical protein
LIATLLGIVVQGRGGPWPAASIQDSVAAIIRQRPYQRSVSATLLDRLLDWLAALIRRVFSAVSEIPNAKWIVLAATIVVLLAIIARLVLAHEADERRRHIRAGAVQGAGDPWAEAERLAAAGSFTEAAHVLYRAVTERLAAAERIRLHPSKTSGDYARELQRRGFAATADFRTFGRRYDHVMFGVGVCDAPTYAQLRDLAARVFRAGERAA